MEFERYLSLLGRLYVQGVGADVHPDLLRRLGGGLALAGRDADWIRIEQDSALGFIDMRRSPADIYRIARQRWREHRAGIMRRIERGERPTEAVENYMRARGTVPNTPESLEFMLQEVIGSAGTHPQWLYNIIEVRLRIQRGLNVMTNTFGGITAFTYLIATAEDWENATPEEWDRAIDAGEVGQAVGQALETGVGIQQARTAQRSRGRSVAEQNPAAIVRSVSPNTRGTQRQRGVEGRRGTTGNPLSSRPASRRISPVHEVSSPNLQDLNIDEAFDENAPFEVSRLRQRTRQRHRRGSRAGQLFQSLDTISDSFTPQQRRSARRLINRFPRRFQAVWRQANNDLARERMRRVRDLWRQGRHEQARSLARSTYNLYRRRFWSRVRHNPRLVQMLEEAGLEFSGGSTSAPFWRLPNGTVERLSLEHTFRVVDQPWQATDGSHIRLVPSRENSNTLEFIRENDPFQNTP